MSTEPSVVAQKTPIAQPTTPEPINTEVGIKWIDHRSRDGVDTFIGQLMLPLQDSRQMVLYHEGQAPNIPFLSTEILIHRQQLRPADELILWDLPPEPAQLQQVLQQVKPQVVHLVGGKYQSIPVHPSPKDFMKVIYQRLSKIWAASEQRPLQLNIETFACQLSTTRTVITHGLLLLAKLEMLSLTVPDEENQETLWVTLLPQADRDNQATQKMGQHLEFMTFQQALKEVGQFRHWVLTTPLEKIKSFAMVETYHSSGAGIIPQENAPHDLIRR